VVIPAASASPQNRVVVLGASNVVRSISVAIRTAHQAFEPPLDFVAACGHGRSYGASSWFLGRVLPGITKCELWDTLDTVAPLPTAALITDIGNDLLYGFSVDQISQWIEFCLRRLQRLTDKLVITQLPMESLRKLGALRFLSVRSLFFPRSHLTLHDAMEGIEKLNRQVIALAEQYGATVIEPDPNWFGIDPVHMKMPYWKAAWKKFFDPVTEKNFEVEKGIHPLDWCALRMIPPRERRLFGITQRRKQPGYRRADGTTISFF
jgi:hypothetical protein